MIQTRIFASSLLAITLAGCAAKGEYPSLAPRPYELAETPKAAPANPGVSDAARVNRITAALEKARATQASFASPYEKARSAVAAAGSQGSDSWIAAQMALSKAERARGPIEDALAELDQERRAILIGGASPDSATVEAAITEAEAIAAPQRASIAALADLLSRR